MSDTTISAASISADKLAAVGQQAQITVFKKALDQSSAIAAQLIEGVKQNPTPPGTGAKINVVA